MHWQIVPSYFHFPLNTQALWARLVPVTMNGSQMFTLSPEDFLLIQSVHNAKHRWERLAWISDIAEIIAACPEIDWPETVERAKESHSLRMVLLGLHLANELLEAPLPEFILQRIEKDTKVRTLAEQVVNLLFASDGIEHGIFEEATFQRFHYQVRERFSDQLTYCVRCLITPSIEDWGWINLPSSLFFLYSAGRPFRLGWKYFKKFWGNFSQRLQERAPSHSTPEEIILSQSDIAGSARCAAG